MRNKLILGLFALSVVFLHADEEKKDKVGIDTANRLLIKQKTGLRNADARKTADGISSWGLNFHGELSTLNKATSNITTSPFSLGSAIGLMMNASKGDTLNELTKNLNIELNTFNVGYGKLSTTLRDLNKENILKWSNSVYSDTAFPIKKSYTDQVKAAMDADSESLDFAQEASLKKINDAVELATGGFIKNLIKNLSGAKAVLLNAGYFKGAWAFEFEVTKTVEKGTFTAPGKTKVQIPMMVHRDRAFLTHQTDEFDMASLAYKGEDFAFDVIVPKWDRQENSKEPLLKLLKVFNSKNYSEWLSKLQVREKVTVSLPRFETEFKDNLISTLRKGMPTAFGAKADLTNMSDVKTVVDQVIHATKLQVNELGSEGGFATAIITRESVSVGNNINADHPFLFVIRHVSSGVPVFVGTVVEPKGLPTPKK